MFNMHVKGANLEYVYYPFSDRFFLLMLIYLLQYIKTGNKIVPRRIYLPHTVANTIHTLPRMQDGFHLPGIEHAPVACMPMYI